MTNKQKNQQGHTPLAGLKYPISALLELLEFSLFNVALLLTVSTAVWDVWLKGVVANTHGTDGGDLKGTVVSANPKTDATPQTLRPGYKTSTYGFPATVTGARRGNPTLPGQRQPHPQNAAPALALPYIW